MNVSSSLSHHKEQHQNLSVIFLPDKCLLFPTILLVPPTILTYIETTTVANQPWLASAKAGKRAGTQERLSAPLPASSQQLLIPFTTFPIFILILPFVALLLSLVK
mmetsp:Transcript_3256/g.9361  ORF Transcript_3256/g.9361 Transcript_3256/m.9361 type:complete len:106 (-) Transcript_3256:580-897(-)